MTIAHLQYDGLKLTPGTIPEELNFDRGLALSSMIREDVEGENLKNVGSLKMNDRTVALHMGAYLVPSRKQLCTTTE